MQYIYNRPRVAADGLPASLLLAFLATAGLFYVNIMPALVEGLKTGLHFSDAQAGMAGSANVYGAAAGAFIATLIITRIRWRSASYALLASLIAIDLISMMVHSALAMVVVRACHGVAGGLLVGIAFSVIARTRKPERTFGMLLLVQGGLGGLGVMFLPQWVPYFGTTILFVALIAFSLVTLLMLPFLDDYPFQITGKHAANPPPRIQWRPLSMSMLGVFLFQFANMLLFAYIIGIARHFSLDTDWAASVVGTSAWIGTLGSVLVIVIATRFGRIRTLSIALLITAAGMWALHASGIMMWYIIANCSTAITWSFTIPYLLGMCAKFDTTGRAAAFGGFASKMGLATGPLVGGLIAATGRYDLLINIAFICIIICMLLVISPGKTLNRQSTY